jgi:hypothetical protein
MALLRRCLAEVRANNARAGSPSAAPESSYSALMPLSRTIFPHSSISALGNVEKRECDTVPVPAGGSASWTVGRSEGPARG